MYQKATYGYQYPSFIERHRDSGVQHWEAPTATLIASERTEPIKIINDNHAQHRRSNPVTSS